MSTSKPCPNDEASRFAPRKPWGALLFHAPDGLEDELAGGLAVFGLGARVMPAADGRSRVEVYLDTPEQAGEAREFAEALLRRAGLDPDGCGLSVEIVADARWLESYQATLKAFPIGRRFTVHPRGRLEEEDGRLPILLVPGRAFGTGEHPTTRLCAEQLERRVAPGSRWLDVGCGSGILSVVARHCGAAEVLALDTDPEAIEVAVEVFRANRVADVAVARRGSAEEAGAGRWDGVVSNISASFALERMDRLAPLLAPGGTLILSGFVGTELDAISNRAAECDLREYDRAESAPWALLAAEVH